MDNRPNSRIHFVVYEASEAPGGAYAQWAQARGHELSYSRVYKGDGLPTPDHFDWLIVMDWPQSPTTTTAECPHFVLSFNPQQ